MLVLIAEDFEDALERRLAARKDHIEYVNSYKEKDQVMFGTALLNDGGQMCGSILFFDLSRDEIDGYLAEEPYVKNKVWDKIEIRECKVGPSFVKNV